MRNDARVVEMYLEHRLRRAERLVTRAHPSWYPQPWTSTPLTDAELERRRVRRAIRAMERLADEPREDYEDIPACVRSLAGTTRLLTAIFGRGTRLRRGWSWPPVQRAHLAQPIRVDEP